MKVKIFDESHESDLEEDINNFIQEKNPDIIDIKYSISNSIYSEEQLYCFSALIMYQDKKE
ncbi:MAG: sporulation protein Cse60 [Bacilli bacterium]|nr:sporulation protein Cse60 [Bacilli bacterium]